MNNTPQFTDPVCSQEAWVQLLVQRTIAELQDASKWIEIHISIATVGDQEQYHAD